MELFSPFEKDGFMFVKDEKGNIYKLVLVSKAISDRTYDNPQLKNKIVDMLSNLQVPTNYSGYEILVECLYFSIKSEEYRSGFSKKLYPKVAEFHGILPSSIASSLTTLIGCWRTQEYKTLFGKKRVSPKTCILTLTDYFLSQNNKES